MFEGAIDFTLDTKGRFAIPARHREALLVGNPSGHVSLTVHPSRCLWMMQPEMWKEYRQKISAVPGTDARAATLKRTMIGNATSEQMDASGRILLAPGLRRHIPIELREKQTLWLVGMEDHLEIWTDEGWRHQNELSFEIRQSGDVPIGFEAIW